MRLDNADTFEYVEERNTQLKAKDATYKPTVILTGELDPAQQSIEKSLTRLTMVEEKALAPVTASGNDQE